MFAWFAAAEATKKTTVRRPDYWLTDAAADVGADVGTDGMLYAGVILSSCKPQFEKFPFDHF